LLASSAASAAEPDEKTKAAARQLAQDGARALDAGRDSEAQDLLDRAYQLYPAPTIAVLEARALERLGRLVEAAEHYEKARRSPLVANGSEAFRNAVADADREVHELRPRIPQLTIMIDGVPPDRAGLDVELDGAQVPRELIGVRRPVDPGEHRITARVGTGAAVERVVQLSERQDQQVVLAVTAPPESVAAPPAQISPAAEPSRGGSAQRTWGWLSLGLGGAGLATGLIAGFIMLDEKSKLDGVCTETCPSESEDDLAAFRSARTVSFIGYGVGIVGLGAGALLLLTAPRAEPERGALSPCVALSLTPAGVGIAASGRLP
jgi:hypothetical protein